MKTYDEKKAILDNFHTEMGDLKSFAALAVGGGRSAKKAAVVSAVDAFRPVIGMYLDELTDAINPVSETAVPALIAALKQTLQGIEKLYPRALPLSDMLMASFELQTQEVGETEFSKLRRDSGVEKF